MYDVVDKPICIETGTSKWDVVFSEFQSGGGGIFAYTRTRSGD